MSNPRMDAWDIVAFCRHIDFGFLGPPLKDCGYLMAIDLVPATSTQAFDGIEWMDRRGVTHTGLKGGFFTTLCRMVVECSQQEKLAISRERHQTGRERCGSNVHEGYNAVVDTENFANAFDLPNAIKFCSDQKQGAHPVSNTEIRRYVHRVWVRCAIFSNTVHPPAFGLKVAARLLELAFPQRIVTWEKKMITLGLNVRKGRHKKTPLVNGPPFEKLLQAFYWVQTVEKEEDLDDTDEHMKTCVERITRKWQVTAVLAAVLTAVLTCCVQ